MATLLSDKTLGRELHNNGIVKFRTLDESHMHMLCDQVTSVWKNGTGIDPEPDAIEKNLKYNMNEFGHGIVSDSIMTHHRHVQEIREQQTFSTWSVIRQSVYPEGMDQFTTSTFIRPFFSKNATSKAKQPQKRRDLLSEWKSPEDFKNKIVYLGWVNLGENDDVFRYIPGSLFSEDVFGPYDSGNPDKKEMTTILQKKKKASDIDTRSRKHEVKTITVAPGETVLYRQDLAIVGDGTSDKTPAFRLLLGYCVTIYPHGKEPTDTYKGALFTQIAQIPAKTKTKIRSWEDFANDPYNLPDVLKHPIPKPKNGESATSTKFKRIDALRDTENAKYSKENKNFYINTSEGTDFMYEHQHITSGAGDESIFYNMLNTFVDFKEDINISAAASSAAASSADVITNDSDSVDDPMGTEAPAAQSLNPKGPRTGVPVYVLYSSDEEDEEEDEEGDYTMDVAAPSLNPKGPRTSVPLVVLDSSEEDDDDDEEEDDQMGMAAPSRNPEEQGTSGPAYVNPRGEEKSDDTDAYRSKLNVLFPENGVDAMSDSNFGNASGSKRKGGSGSNVESKRSRQDKHTNRESVEDEDSESDLEEVHLSVSTAYRSFPGVYYETFQSLIDPWLAEQNVTEVKPAIYGGKRVSQYPMYVGPPGNGLLTKETGMFAMEKMNEINHKVYEQFTKDVEYVTDMRIRTKGKDERRSDLQYAIITNLYFGNISKNGKVKIGDPDGSGKTLKVNTSLLRMMAAKKFGHERRVRVNVGEISMDTFSMFCGGKVGVKCIEDNKTLIYEYTGVVKEGALPGSTYITDSPELPYGNYHAIITNSDKKQVAVMRILLQETTLTTPRHLEYELVVDNILTTPVVDAYFYVSSSPDIHDAVKYMEIDVSTFKRRSRFEKECKTLKTKKEEDLKIQQTEEKIRKRAERYEKALRGLYTTDREDDLIKAARIKIIEKSHTVIKRERINEIIRDAKNKWVSEKKEYKESKERVLGEVGKKHLRDINKRHNVQYSLDTESLDMCIAAGLIRDQGYYKLSDEKDSNAKFTIEGFPAHIKDAPATENISVGGVVTLMEYILTSIDDSFNVTITGTYTSQGDRLCTISPKRGERDLSFQVRSNLLTSFFDERTSVQFDRELYRNAVNISEFFAGKVPKPTHLMHDSDDEEYNPERNPWDKHARGLIILAYISTHGKDTFSDTVFVDLLGAFKECILALSAATHCKSVDSSVKDYIHVHLTVGDEDEKSNKHTTITSITTKKDKNTGKQYRDINIDVIALIKPVIAGKGLAFIPSGCDGRKLRMKSSRITPLCSILIAAVQNTVARFIIFDFIESPERCWRTPEELNFLFASFMKHAYNTFAYRNAPELQSHVRMMGVTYNLGREREEVNRSECEDRVVEMILDAQWSPPPSNSNPAPPI